MIFSNGAITPLEIYLDSVLEDNLIVRCPGSSVMPEIDEMVMFNGHRYFVIELGVRVAGSKALIPYLIVISNEAKLKDQLQEVCQKSAIFMEVVTDAEREININGREREEYV